MAIYITTSHSQQLIDRLNRTISSFDINEWSVDKTGDYTINYDEWRYHAWMRPNLINEELLVFGIVQSYKFPMTNEVYGEYHGRLVSTLLKYFSDLIKDIRTTSNPDKSFDLLKLFEDDAVINYNNRKITHKENMMERTIKLTLDKAKEWYKQGGELKEFALQAYEEEELTRPELPKTWEEFCHMKSIRPIEAFISEDSLVKEVDTMIRRDESVDRTVLPSINAAKAHLALMQLHQLRDCYRQGWKPKFGDKTFKYGIGHYSDERGEHWQVKEFDCPHTFLCFQDEATARDFLHNFKNLIKQAGDLI